MSIRKQCRLLAIPRSHFYYQAEGEKEQNLALMHAIDKLYTAYPFYGARRILANLPLDFQDLNLKRVRRLMRLMGIEAIYPKPKLSLANRNDKKYPYLLENELIRFNNQVWSTDITYIPMTKGFLYLVAIMDWHSRFILSWRLSNSLSLDFCVDCLENSLARWTKPAIFNSDQGSQFTSSLFVQILENQGISISRDGKGRALDNVFIERFWRSLKYECIYLHSFADGKELQKGLEKYVYFYNFERKHQALNYLTPAQIYLENKAQF